MSKRLKKVDINESTPSNRRIAWWMENTLIRWVKRLYNAIGENVRELMAFSVSDIFESFEQELIPMVKPFLQALLNTPGLPSWFKSPIEKALSGTSPVGLVILALIVPIAAAALSRGVEGPIGRMIEYAIDNVVRSRLFDPGTAILMWQRGILTEPRVDTILHMNGLTNDAIIALKKLSKRTIDDDLLTTAYWRKDLPVSRISDRLKERGYSDENIALWYNARTVIPSPSQLISMAVREAWNDDVAQTFGYDEGYPADAAAWAKKQGMDEVWFRRAWRAHWVLPGLNQVREMFHRGIINENAVKQFLVASDIPRFWRDTIITWMFREVTRVDVRRIFSLGLISVEDVYTRYLKLGYNEQDSSLMTEWTVAEYQDKDKELTKTDILNMYENNILNENETTTYLTALGYREDSIVLLMVHRDLKRQEKYENLVISNTKKLFIAGTYSATDVYSELGKLDTPGHYIEETLKVWRLEQKAKIRIPSITQLRDMQLTGAITHQTFVDEMKLKGYADKYIGWFSTMWFTED